MVIGRVKRRAVGPRGVELLSHLTRVANSLTSRCVIQTAIRQGSLIVGRLW